MLEVVSNLSTVTPNALINVSDDDEDGNCFQLLSSYYVAGTMLSTSPTSVTPPNNFESLQLRKLRLRGLMQLAQLVRGSWDWPSLQHCTRYYGGEVCVLTAQTLSEFIDSTLISQLFYF